MPAFAGGFAAVQTPAQVRRSGGNCGVAGGGAGLGNEGRTHSCTSECDVIIVCSVSSRVTASEIRSAEPGGRLLFLSRYGFVLHVYSLQAELVIDRAILIQWAPWPFQPHLGTRSAFESKQWFAVNYCSALGIYWAETWIPLKKTFLRFILIFGDNVQVGSTVLLIRTERVPGHLSLLEPH